MPKSLKFFLWLACGWFLLPHFAWAIEPVRVGVYQNSPLVEIEPDGSPRGLFIDILEHVAAEERWPLAYRACAWTECLQLLDQGELDLLPVIAVSPARGGHYAFTAEAVVSNWGKVFGRPGSHYESILDLDGRSVAVMTGDIYAERLKTLAGGFNIAPRWIEVSDYAAVMESLAAGGADAGVVSRIFGMANASDYAVLDTNVVFQPTTLHFAAARGSGEVLVEAIDRLLASEKKDRGSDYYQALDYWLHQQEERLLPPWLKRLLLAAALVLALSIGFNLLLRARVRVNTRHLREALEVARESRENIKAILYSVADGLLVTDPGGLIRQMNPAAERLLGIECSQALSRPLCGLLAELGLCPELAAALAGPPGSASVELTIPQERGEDIQVQARSAPVLSAAGMPAGVITVLRDVTREHEADRLKNEFISTAAHELNTPLTSILGFSELLLDEGRLTPEQQRESLATIHAKGEVLARIVADLLSLSRIETGHILVVEKAPTDINGLVRELVEPYRLKSFRHRFELCLPAESALVPVDAGKIVQVLENLLSNAVKYSPKGGPILLEASLDQEFYRLAISDPGIGMTAGQLERIYDKFYRVDASNTAVGGLGLGMSIVRDIIEAHGGTIQVTSQPGQGTRVSFALPR